MTFLRMKIRFEPMDHNANLNISVEEGKNMKHPEIKGPISTRVTVRTQRGQEYSTGVVINSKTPQWSQMFNFGIGPSTHEIDVSVDMIDPIERFAEEQGVGTLCRDILVENGLVMRAVGDTIVAAPPLVLTHGEADELLEKARLCLDLTLEALDV